VFYVFLCDPVVQLVKTARFEQDLFASMFLPFCSVRRLSQAKRWRQKYPAVNTHEFKAFINKLPDIPQFMNRFEFLGLMILSCHNSVASFQHLVAACRAVSLRLIRTRPAFQVRTIATLAFSL